MHGDFTLNPLAYRDRVSRVLAQQGRVQLDSDWNEQTESLLRFLRGLAIDVIGHHGGVNDSFEIIVDPQRQVSIRWGEYYVDGIRCVNLPDADILGVLGGLIATPPVDPPFKDGLPFNQQRDDFNGQDGPLDKVKEPLVFYLDAFERHISAAEDDSLREVALLGPDTASRAVVVWRVRVAPAKPLQDMVDAFGKLKDKFPKEYDPWYVALNLHFRGNVLLRAQAKFDETTDPCIVAPDAQFRGTANRLFRVEIHTPGDPDPAKKQPATFKWSADNGSIVYPIREVDGTTVFLDSLGRDERTRICINDWVEVVDDEVDLMGDVAPKLLQVLDVRASDVSVVLSDVPPNKAGTDPNRHPILRRWATQVIPITEAAGAADQWVELTDGVEVQFSLASKPAHYRTGDYWLIPARTATADVIWPRDGSTPRALPPHGVHHHYAPLAKYTPDRATGGGAPLENLRWTFAPLAKKT